MPAETKESRKKGHVKLFQQDHMELENGLILYYDTPLTARVRQILTRVIPVKFIRVVM